MQTIAKAVSAIALVGTIAPAVLLVTGAMELPAMKGFMLASTILWFIATPLWMDRQAKG